MAVLAGAILAVTAASLYTCYSREQRAESVFASDQDRATSRQHALQSNPVNLGSIAVLAELAEASISKSGSTKSAESHAGATETAGITDPSDTSSPNDTPADDTPSDETPPDDSISVISVVCADEKMQETIPDGKISFSTTSIYSIYIYVLWKNIQGCHDQVIHVYCPDGQL